MHSEIDHESGGVSHVFDAMHGNISLVDFVPELHGQIGRLASAPFIERLKRVKQLGFVSQNFLSAQHNRYAHALGTAHIMVRLIRQLENTGLFERALRPLFELTEDEEFDPDRSERGSAFLKQHLLVAALIQDVGELPYETACSGIFKTGHAVRTSLGNSGVDLHQMSEKDRFTLYFVWKDPDGFFAGLNKQLLTYLISGLAPGVQDTTGELATLREMLDGRSVDADRLDYVYRDAFHTIGTKNTAESLINSIVGYDQDGVIVSHVRPVTDFMVTRAMLWSNVYLSPENRFRIILLKRALNELVEKQPQRFHQWFGFPPGEINPEDFLRLDDGLVDQVIRTAATANLDLDRTPFELLRDGAASYHYRWVKFSEVVDPACPGSLELPVEFFWDTYADYRERTHTLYERHAVRVQGERYALIGEEVGLEDCVGPFSRVLNDGDWPAFPMPDHMVWFGPAEHWSRPTGAWKRLVNFKGAQQLTLQLQFRDPVKGVRSQWDTRGTGLRGPAIFLAFSWADRDYLDRVASVLTDLGRQFWALTDGRDNYGASPASNSKKAVDEAGAIILLASKSYLQTYADRPDEGLHAEVSRMEARCSEIPIIPMALDDHSVLQSVTSFPWRSISADGTMAYVGDNLRLATSSEFRRSVQNAVKKIDQFYASQD